MFFYKPTIVEQKLSTHSHGLYKGIQFIIPLRNNHSKFIYNDLAKALVIFFYNINEMNGLNANPIHECVDKMQSYS